MHFFSKYSFTFMVGLAKIFVIAGVLLSLSSQSAFSQNNPYKIDDELYKYYDKCMRNINSPVVLKMSDTMFNMAKAKGDVKAQCLALNARGEHFYYINDIKNLLIEKDRVGNFARKTPYTQYVFSIWNKVINYYLTVNNISKAMEEVRLYQKEALQLDNAYGIGNSYKKLSDLYLIIGDFDTAIDELKKAEDYYNSVNLKKELYNIYAALGNIYLSTNKYDESIKYYSLAVETSPSEAPKGPFYLSLARNYISTGDLQKAKHYMQLTEEWAKKYKMSQVHFMTKCKLYTEYYMRMGDYQKAMKYADSLPENNSYIFKSDLYEKMGDYKNAYKYFLKYDAIEKQYLDITSRNNLAQYTALYDKERVENEKNVLALKNSQLALDQLRTKDRLLAAEKAGNVLALSNTKLELSNKTLALKNQQIEAAKQKAEASRQRLIGINLKQHASSQRNLAIVLIIIFMILSGVAIAYALQRQRTARKLHEEVDNVKRAREEADRAREAAEKSQKEAENANKMKSLFIQNMSHEIRTPLNAIIGFTDLMNDPSSELDNADKEQFRGLIHDNGNLLTTLINDILDLSKLESGTYDIHIESLSALNVCKNAVASVQSRVKKNVKLILDSAEGNIIFDSDPQRVLQVLTNLLTNACKCTDNGNITLSYKKIDDNISFSVTDTGCGVPVEDAEKIFDRFEKLDKFKQGTGLGLNICRQIATLLKGKIYVDTSYTGGARFIFEQPIHQAS
jgi:signal transduction histidine kinase